MYNKLLLKPATSFSLNIGSLLLLVFVADTYILNAEFFEQAINANGLDWNSILINRSPGFKLLLYTSSALLLLLKYSLISILIYTTFYLNNSKTSFQSIFKLVCLAELIFLIPAAIKVIWFVIVPPTALEHWTAFYPLSIHSILSTSSIPLVIVYPLQLLNLFELLYILTLAFLLHHHFKNSYDRSLRYVLISYLPGLLVWTLIATYFTVMLYQN